MTGCDGEDVEVGNPDNAVPAASKAEDRKFSEEELLIIQKLSMREYHLPGNSYFQDFAQYVCNNHPILSFCYAHHLHPFGIRDRIFCLAGSLAFGLGATCGVYLFFYSLRSDSVDVGPFVVSESVVALVAAVLNSWFDIAVWYIQMCPCCQPGGAYDERCGSWYWIWCGQNLAATVVIMATSVALVVCIMRSTIHEEEGKEGAESFSFVRVWAIEVLLSLVVIYPVLAMILFSGVLGCFRLPVIGGRPWELRSEKECDDEDGMESSHKWWLEIDGIDKSKGQNAAEF